MSLKTFNEIASANEHMRSELTNVVLRFRPTDYKRNAKGEPEEPLYSEKGLLFAARMMNRGRNYGAVNARLAAG